MTKEISEARAGQGFKAEMQAVAGDWACNAQVWPDEDSAHSAGHNLLMRWMGCKSFRVIEVDEEPNMPTWEEQVEAHGLPPMSVKL